MLDNRFQQCVSHVRITVVGGCLAVDLVSHEPKKVSPVWRTRSTAPIIFRGNLVAQHVVIQPYMLMSVQCVNRRGLSVACALESYVLVGPG